MQLGTGSSKDHSERAALRRVRLAAMRCELARPHLHRYRRSVLVIAGEGVSSFEPAKNGVVAVALCDVVQREVGRGFGQRKCEYDLPPV